MQQGSGDKATCHQPVLTARCADPCAAPGRRRARGRPWHASSRGSLELAVLPAVRRAAILPPAKRADAKEQWRERLPWPKPKFAMRYGPHPNRALRGRAAGGAHGSADGLDRESRAFATVRQASQNPGDRDRPRNNSALGNRQYGKTDRTVVGRGLEAGRIRGGIAPGHRSGRLSARRGRGSGQPQFSIAARGPFQRNKAGPHNARNRG